jgi:hypothetical protein
MKASSVSVVISSGSPVVTISVAALPTSREPCDAPSPRISAARIVTAFSASSGGSP